MQYTLQREICKKLSPIGFVLQICIIILAYDRYAHFYMNCADPSYSKAESFYNVNYGSSIITSKNISNENINTAKNIFWKH